MGGPQDQMQAIEKELAELKIQLEVWMIYDKWI